jgi:hypothetical protein
VKQLCRNDQEHAGENEADDVTTRLIEYRHKKGTTYNLRITELLTPKEY